MGIPSIKQDLTFTPTQELIDEITKRHDALVITGIKLNTADAYTLTRHYSGNRYFCMGMMTSMQGVINEAEEKHLKFRTK